MAPKSLGKSCSIYADTWSSRNGINPEQVSISNGKKFWFDCHKCGHYYHQTPSDKLRGNGCPYCSNKKRCGDCLFCLPKSCNIYSGIWSSKNELKPEQVAISSHKKYFFDCPDCKHSYEQTPANKTKGNRCHFCSNKKICGDISCLFCLPKSCNIYSGIWSSKNELKPEQVAISSHKKYFFDCHYCKHNYEQSPSHKTRGHGCRYCARYNSLICCDLSCLFCLLKSCNVYVDTWSLKNNKKPYQVSISSTKKYWFLCLRCNHEYNQSPNSKKQGAGCPYCILKSERKLADYLKEIGVDFKREFKINSKKRYDFFITKFKLIIEVDGEQHFKQVSNWKKCEDNLENDIQKMKVALENGYSAGTVP
jgi:hypothetical protein